MPQSPPPPGPPPPGPPPPGYGPPPGAGAPSPGTDPLPGLAASRSPTLATPWPLVVALGLALVVLAVVGVVLLSRTVTVGSLAAGDCLGSSGLAAGESTVVDLEVVGCGSPHDGEVLAVLTLDGEADATAACGSEVGTVDDLTAAGVEVRPLTEPGEDGDGDSVACVARRIDGAVLTGRVGQA